MEQDRYNALFAPQSVAVIGASDRPDSVGGVVFANVLKNYKGKVYPVNSKRQTVAGHQAYRSISDVPGPVDLAVIATPASTIPAIIEACAQCGVKGAAVLAAGFPEAGQAGRDLTRMLVEITKHHAIRIIGPACLGIVRPSLGLNAAFLNITVNPGQIALVSQSAALCSAVLDAAQINNVGFSSVITLGAATDVDLGEVLDFLAGDEATESIMLYLEGVHNARRFMSALSAASRIKPVVVLKAGRHASGSTTALSHSGALLGSDAVFESALVRAGAVRIDTLNQFLAATKALSARHKTGGNRLAVVTNGNGPGIMAADRMAAVRVELAALSPATVTRLNAILPPDWSHTNPLDILGDADAARYNTAVKACLEDPGVDGVLVLLSPLWPTRPLEVANAMIALAQESAKPLLTCWMGETHVHESRDAFVATGVPSIRTPEAAVDAFSCIARYQRNQQFLRQLPPPSAVPELASLDGATLLIEGVLSSGRKVLTELESKAVLAAFRIPVTQSAVARSGNEALALAEQIGFPVAMKVSSPDITHKSDVGGVRLNVSTPQGVKTAYNDILAEVTRNHPQATIEGVAIQAMVSRPNGRELTVGIARDDIFGPVITFGAGGTLVEMIGDQALTLPPLNGFLAGQFIARAPVSRLLSQFRNMPAVEMEALENVLLRVSEMACELPWLKEMDINPLLVDDLGALALDARIVVDYIPHSMPRYGHMAIHPYPAHLVNQWQMPDGTNVTIRPVRPEDSEMEQEFVRNLSAQSRYFRFMGTLKELTPTMLLRFTQYDYDREIALTAVTTVEGAEVEIGVARYITERDGHSCEFAVVVADAWQGHGVGHHLMLNLMAAARAKGLTRMRGEVLADNEGMLTLMHILGFSVATSRDDHAIKEVRISL